MRTIFFLIYYCGHYFYNNKSFLFLIDLTLIYIILINFNQIYHFPDSENQLQVDHGYAEKFSSAGAKTSRTVLEFNSTKENDVFFYGLVRDSSENLARAIDNNDHVEIGWSYLDGHFLSGISRAFFGDRYLYYAKIDDVYIVEFERQTYVYEERFKRNRLYLITTCLSLLFLFNLSYFLYKPKGR